MSDTSPKGRLPDGWKVMVSKNFPDRVYYFNTFTGCSTWECPVLDVPGSNHNKKSKSSSIMSKPSSSKYASSHPEVKSPEIKIDKFLSDARKESLKRSTDNDTSSGQSRHSKPSTPPTAIVAPVVLDKSLISVTKKKRKRPKKQRVAPSLQVPCTTSDNPSGTILLRKDSNDASHKVSFSIKSKNKIPICKSENSILQKSKTFTPVFKKKQSLVVSLPAPKNQDSASLDRGKRCVTLDKSSKLPPPDFNTTSKEPLNRRPSLNHRFSPPQSVNTNQNTKDERHSKIPTQNQLKESTKRKSDVLHTIPAEDLLTTGEMSDMDCEMDSEFEDLEITVTNPGINVGASTSKGSDPESCDIEMLDMSSSDLVTIDDIFGFQGSLVEKYFIAVDTNVFISELQYIDEMKDTPVNGSGPPHFIIPWVVFQELDNLKRNGGRPKHGIPKEAKTRKTHDVMKSAGEAIRYLNTLLKAKHPRFHFQHPDEAKNCRKDFSRNNDDQLLECCLKLQERIAKEKVILLTNDKNLANKAMVCSIAVHDRKSLLTILKPDFATKGDSPPKQISNPTFVPDPFKVLSEQKAWEQQCQANHRKCELQIDIHMSSARQLLKDVLEPLFVKEMDEAYGDAWHFFQVERHTLKGILMGISRYWRTVFTFFFKKDIHEKFEILKEKAKRPEGFLGERGECLEIIYIIDELFAIIKKKWPDIKVPITEIPKIKAQTEEAFSELSKCEKTLINIENLIKNTEMSCCTEVFNHNWTVINHLCGCALDFCGLPHNLVYDTTAPVPGKPEFLRIMPKLHELLGKLKEVMNRMLDVVKSSTTNGSAFRELHKMLLDLVPSLNIQAQNICTQHFSAKLLERFCRLPENRSKIEEGYKQLMNFHERLGKAVSVLLEMP